MLQNYPVMYMLGHVEMEGLPQALANPGRVEIVIRSGALNV